MDGKEKGREEGHWAKEISSWRIRRRSGKKNEEYLIKGKKYKKKREKERWEKRQKPPKRRLTLSWWNKTSTILLCLKRDSFTMANAWPFYSSKGELSPGKS